MRVPTHRYRDPIDEIWLAAARRIGFAVERTAEAYAATRGDGKIGIGSAELLDADDGLGQMLLHELCHALVEGEAAWSLPDWGLDNTSVSDEPREHACLRLQAALLAPRGLRRVLAPTTEYRSFYDALPADPLAGPGAEHRLARIALGRAGRRPFAPALDEALAATEAVARAAAPFAEPTSLWARVEIRPDLHPLGFQFGSSDGSTCGGCTWLYHARGADRCRQAGKRVEPTWSACDRFEPALDCQDCGACCREAYHSVTVPARDAVVRLHPELIVRREGYLEIRREGARCAALAVAASDAAADRYACGIYEARPKPCRDFERAGANCIDARRRVGLSR